jgi:hypothetical protein
MTQVTPPGWYPDPGQTQNGPPIERWWDGSRWTDQIRSAPATGPWGPHAYAPVVPPPRRGLRTAIGVGVVVVVLACIGGGVFALAKDGDDGTRAGTPAASGPSRGGGEDGPRKPGGPSRPDTPDAPGPQQEDGYVADPSSGISLPVPDGWTGQVGTIGAQVTTDTYPCPGDPKEQCVRAGASSQPALALDLKQSTARAVAEADIAQNAKDSYGGKVYGSVTSHEELAAQAVDVAGKEGYLVRWKVVTSKGDDGYVESLAFPSPAAEDVLVVVRFGFDVNAAAPKLATMDEITKGIKKSALVSGGGEHGKQV